MPRDIPVGNGSMLVTFDSQYRIRDIYYPHIGEENHTQGHCFRFGIWIDNRFSWVDKDSWDITLGYKQDTIVTDVRLENHDLELILECNDTVDFIKNIYIRRIKVTDRSGQNRQAKLFFSHDFFLYGNRIGDTAVYDPITRTVIHYKNNRYFLIGGCATDSCGLVDYAIGRKEVNEDVGTWKDAEDGSLSQNPIEQGSVDSTVALPVNTDGGVVHYWIAAGSSRQEVVELNSMILRKQPAHLVERTENYWRFWLDKERVNCSALPESIITLYRRSLLVVRTQIDNDGAIIAANDTDVMQFAKDTYSYMWPRDGALVANALDEAGYPEITKKFFNFCFEVIEKDGYLLHKYNPDKSPASSWHPWISDGMPQLPIQEDETALVIWALWKHFELYRDIEFIKPIYKGLIKRAADFFCKYRYAETGLPKPSYDLWEERRGVLTFTCCTVYAGLIAAANFADGFGEIRLAKKYRRVAKEIKSGMTRHLYSKEHGRFLRMVNFNDGIKTEDATIDASLYALFEFGVYPVDDPMVASTMSAVKNNLWCNSPVGGVARYQNDYYYQVSQDIENVPGNPWFICTMWLALYYIERAENINDLEKAVDVLNWVESRALPSGVLAEQVHPYDNQPLSVSPLTWSHATFIQAVMRYLKKREQLDRCPECGGSKSICRSSTC